MVYQIRWPVFLINNNIAAANNVLPSSNRIRHINNETVMELLLVFEMTKK
jgi:hypothetical protein